ncbi:MAG: calcium-binding protein [Gemmobacter sp.]|nr:calcium-binding protein [Gemmobacter sp.]
MAIRRITESDPDSDGLPGGDLRFAQIVIVEEQVTVNASLKAAGLFARNGVPVLGATLVVEGTLHSETNGIDFVTNAAEDDANFIRISETGWVFSKIRGVLLGGQGSELVNEGLIESFETVTDHGTGNTIHNIGRISGRGTGNFSAVSLGLETTLVNTGEITGRGTAIRFGVPVTGIGVPAGTLAGRDALLDNSGSISGQTAILVATGSGHRIGNSGSIHGSDTAIKLVAGGSRIENTGEIFGGETGIAVAIKGGGIVTTRNLGTIGGGEAAYADTGAATDRIFNSGTLLGDVETGGGSDSLRNLGVIDGFVRLGEAGDAYRGIGAGYVTGIVFGEAGVDQLFGGQLDDRLDGGDGNDILLGFAGEDALTGGEGDDLLAGGTGDDLLLADAGNDRVQGGDGDDSGSGGAGDDSLTGGRGDDDLSGGAGDDYLNGGAGEDVLTGGKGFDTFRFVLGNGDDSVTDFTYDIDLIDLRAFGLLGLQAMKDAGAIVQTAGGTLIDFGLLGGDGSVLLERIIAADLIEGDFLF